MVLGVAKITALLNFSGDNPEFFKHDNFIFCGDFTLNGQKDCLPYNLKLLISMILYGRSLKSEETRFSRMSHCRTTYSIQHQKSTRKRSTKA